MEAQEALDNRDDPIPEMEEELVRVSEASKSESRWDQTFEDGSVLTGTSREGADVEWSATEPPPDEEPAPA